MKEIEVNLDIDMWRVPCDLLSINFLSSQSSTQSLSKQRIDADANYLPFEPSSGMDQIENAIRSKEGCKLSGTIFNHFVEPVITIGYGGIPPPILMMLMGNLPEFTFNLSHTINHFSIGKKNDCMATMIAMGQEPSGCFGISGKKTIELDTPGKQGQHYRHTYFVNVFSFDLDRAK